MGRLTDGAVAAAPALRCWPRAQAREAAGAAPGPRLLLRALLLSVLRSQRLAGSNPSL